MNHYEALGVKISATQDDIKAAYRVAARKAHPDREGGTVEAMSRVNVAYDALSNPRTRHVYDLVNGFLKARVCKACNGTGKTSTRKGWVVKTKQCEECG